MQWLKAWIKTLLGHSELCPCGNPSDDGWDQCRPIDLYRCNKELGIK